MGVLVHGAGLDGDDLAAPAAPTGPLSTSHADVPRVLGGEESLVKLNSRGFPGCLGLWKKLCRVTRFKKVASRYQPWRFLAFRLPPLPTSALARAAMSRKCPGVCLIRCCGPESTEEPHAACAVTSAVQHAIERSTFEPPQANPEPQPPDD